MKNRLDAGFTLIELMIVVAIIGLLAVMAIPNYLSMQCRAKRTEAKMSMAGAFTTQSTFFAEHKMYTTDLAAMNWHPEHAPRYLYGYLNMYPAGPAPIPGPGAFIATDGTPVDPSQNHTAHAAVVSIGFITVNMTHANGTPLAPADLPALPGTCEVNGPLGVPLFEICAVGNIDPDDNLDKIGYDDSRVFVSYENDCG